MILKLKLQYFGQLKQRAYSLEKTLVLGKTEGRRSLSFPVLQFMGSQRVRYDLATEQTTVRKGMNESEMEKISRNHK